MVRPIRLLAVAVVALVAWAPAEARAGWGVGIRIGFPLYLGPSYYPNYYYYRPYPVVVAPAPVVLAPAPVYQPYPAYQAAAPVQAPAVAYAAAPTAYQPLATDDRLREIQHHVQHLNSPDERVRADVVMQLGRLRDSRAVDPVTATLVGDSSPVVREAAARALGLIGAPQAVPALQRAAQMDSDRGVRRSAQFAGEMLQGR